MNFISQYLPVRYEFTGELARKEIPQLPYEALREALINAVIHRDYFEKGANVMVEMFGDRIEITNPGGLVKGLTPENFGKISMLRNPGIANLFKRIDYIEKMGTGIERIRLELKKAKVPQVQYELMPSFVKAVFPRPEEVAEIAAQETAQEKTQKRTQKRTQKQQAILDFLKAHPEAGRKDIADNIDGVTENGVKSIIRALQQKNLLRRIGPDRGGHWEVMRVMKLKMRVNNRFCAQRKRL
jgi:ATP-dependent DNA helicase RecG